MKSMNALTSMKVMKSLKAAHKPTHAAMKKPAGKGGKALEEAAVLSETALQKLNGASEDKIQDFINKLSDKDQQTLWKKYERVRKADGTDDDYKAATNGPGRQAKVMSSLKVFLQSGCSTKTAFWRKNITSFKAENIQSHTSNWQPMQFMLTKYGGRELKARVLAGTIQVRACPADARFPEFKEILDSSTDRTVKGQETMAEQTGRTNCEGFRLISDIQNNGQKITFLPEADDDDPDKLARSLLDLGTKPDGPQNALAGTGDSASQHLQPFDAYETASAINDKTDIKVCLVSMVKVRTGLSNTINQMEDGRGGSEQCQI